MRKASPQATAGYTPGHLSRLIEALFSMLCPRRVDRMSSPGIYGPNLTRRKRSLSITGTGRFVAETSFVFGAPRRLAADGESGEARRRKSQTAGPMMAVKLVDV